MSERNRLSFIERVALAVLIALTLYVMTVVAVASVYEFGLKRQPPWASTPD